MIHFSKNTDSASSLLALMHTSWMDVAEETLGMRSVDNFLPSSVVDGWDVFKKVTYDFSKRFLDASLSDLVVGAGIGAGLSVLGAISSPLLLGATAVMHVGAVVDGFSFLTQETGDLFHLNASALSVGVGVLGALAMVGVMAVLGGTGERIPTAEDIVSNKESRWRIWIEDEQSWMKIKSFDIYEGDLVVHTHRPDLDSVIISPQEFLELQKRYQESIHVTKEAIARRDAIIKNYPINTQVIVYNDDDRAFTVTVRGHDGERILTDRPGEPFISSRDGSVQSMCPPVRLNAYTPEELSEFAQRDTADVITDETSRTTPAVLATAVADLSALREEFYQWRSVRVLDDLDGEKDLVVARVTNDGRIIVGPGERIETFLNMSPNDTLPPDFFNVTPEQLREWNPV